MGIFRRKKSGRRGGDPSLAAEAGTEAATEGVLWLIFGGARKVISAVAHALT
ncbi:hypothetical protein [Nocardia inohanensis]|uniref:hypothetical protein n=1 Tax=Nocardia inohanensis TaxID=209246 RepID=UPI000A8451B9|nr:hypothetical protein [Nocardia inohanensis]